MHRVGVRLVFLLRRWCVAVLVRRWSHPRRLGHRPLPLAVHQHVAVVFLVRRNVICCRDGFLSTCCRILFLCGYALFTLQRMRRPVLKMRKTQPAPRRRLILIEFLARVEILGRALQRKRSVLKIKQKKWVIFRMLLSTYPSRGDS